MRCCEEEGAKGKEQPTEWGAEGNAASQSAHASEFCCGSRVSLLTTLPARQKTLREQTESLQRRERRKCAIKRLMHRSKCAFSP